MRSTRAATVRCHVALLLLAGLLLPITVMADGRPANTPALPVVRTFADLYDQCAIDLGGGVTVRLGIEAVESPQHGGVLVYALVTDWIDPPQRREGVGMPLGPVDIEVLPWGAEPLRDLRVWHMQTLGWPKEGDLLFAAAAPIVGGDMVVRVFPAGATPNDVMFAETRLRQSDGPGHPWLPLDHADEPVEPLAVVGVGDADRIPRVTLASIGPALPNVIGQAPLWAVNRDDEKLTLSPVGGLLSVAAQQRPLNHPLPRLVPDESNDEIKAEPREQSLRITFNDGLGVGAEPERSWLARWWVNDKPFTQDAPIHAEQFDRRLGPVSQHVGTIEFELVDVVHDLGAAPGDIIETQLLFCPNGWIALNMPNNALAHVLFEFVGMHTPQLTNSVAWRVSEQGELMPRAAGDP